MAEGIAVKSAAGRWIIFACVLGSGVAAIDATVVNVALPRIAEELGGGFRGLQWIINAYTLTLAAFILLGGTLGDRFGRRRIFVVGVIWFAGASVACGLAPNVSILTVARALQGIGGALLTPGSLAIISSAFRGQDRTAAIGAWSGLSGLAGAAGPFLGGYLVEISWRLAFLINLPVAMAVVAVTVRHVPESCSAAARPGLNIVGALLMVLGLGGLTHGLTSLGDGGPPAEALIAVSAGVAALAGFVASERRSPTPLVPSSLFGNRTFVAANLMTLLIYGAMGTVFLILTLQLQIVSGFTPVAAGAALLPVTAVMLLFSARAGVLAGRIGPRLPLTVGTLIAAGGLLLMVRIGSSASWTAQVLPAALTFGVGMVLVVAPLTSAALDAAPSGLAGAASGVNNAVARTGGLLAVAVIPGIAGISTGDYSDPAVFGAGFRTAMMLAALLFVVSSVVALVGVGRQTRRSARMRIEHCLRCDVGGPAQHPGADIDQLRFG